MVIEPQVFISYSWSSVEHQNNIIELAERLAADGVVPILDVWNLKEGDDKYAFMEKMVTDDSVTHVLIFSDSVYASKADSREAGVGTETQIISNEIYAKTEQSKFIPIVWERNDGRPCLPAFLANRKWLDFSSAENINKNWEQLIRLLFGKPAHQKPEIGKPPTYITENTSVPASPAVAKFMTLRQALLEDKKGVNLFREEFLNGCYQYIDDLRIRDRPNIENVGARVLEDCTKLKLARNHIMDWVLLESRINRDSVEFCDALIAMLEKLLELKSRPPEVRVWSDVWYDAHRVFVYETFLYTVAALIKNNSIIALMRILNNRYLLPETEDGQLESFSSFYAYTDALQVLALEGRKLHAPAAEFIKQHADREDITFPQIKEAELLIFIMACIANDGWWNPQTLYYSNRGTRFPFFVRATQHNDFMKLAKITGIDNGDDFRHAVKEGLKRLQLNQWGHRYVWADNLFWNIEKLDTL